MSKEIRVVKGPTLRGKIPTVVGVISAEILVNHYFVPYRNSVAKTGYQRNPTASRITQLANSIKNKGVDLPTSVLVNIRGVSENTILGKVAADRYVLSLDATKRENEHRLYVVDGQHRIIALEKAMVDYDASIGHINIPFVAMLGANEQQEMEQFYVVNKNSKPVPIDLAYAILSAADDKNLDFVKNIIERRGTWEIEGQRLVDELAKTSSIWKGWIRLANAPIGDAVVPSASFIKSLRQILTQVALVRNQPLEKQVQLLNAYWIGIGRIYPNAQENPRKYTIHKGLGVNVFHNIYPVILDLARTNHESIFDPATYTSLMETALQQVEGLNGEGISVSGEDFWLTGSAGAAGSYSSGAGQGRLSKQLLGLLPDPELY